MSEQEYNEHSMNATVSRIETKLDSALNAMTEQNRRLILLENAENKRVGALATIGIICGFIGTGLTLLFEHLKK